MAKTQFTHKKQSISPKSLLGALVALIVVFLLMTSVVSVIGKYMTSRNHIDELTQEKQTLQAKEATLKKMNDYVATPAGTEQILRQKYNVIKPGEGVIVVADTEPTVPIQPVSRVHRWWNAILAGVGFKKD